VELSDPVLRHLRKVVDLPDLAGTRYRLEEEIGRGGLGVVYAARDTQLDRRVALKVMDAQWAGEARLIARLEHPGIVPVYETGALPDGRAFYAMKLVAGTRADRYVEGNPPLGERLRVVQRVGEALAYAHSCGVLHRDLKPQNVMVGPFGEVYVMDWGVEGVAGTPAFRAPETSLDQRSDVYALGAFVRFVLPGDAPPALGAIAVKAMSERPRDRYPDVAEVLREIERFQDGLAVKAYAESPWQRVRRFARRNEVLLWLLAAYAGVKFLLFFCARRLKKPSATRNKREKEPGDNEQDLSRVDFRSGPGSARRRVGVVLPGSPQRDCEHHGGVHHQGNAGWAAQRVVCAQGEFHRVGDCGGLRAGPGVCLCGGGNAVRNRAPLSGNHGARIRSGRDYRFLDPKNGDARPRET
jgi:serine/threonine protein kinase